MTATHCDPSPSPYGGPMVAPAVVRCLEAGLALIPIPLGTKKPNTMGWNARERALFGLSNAPRFAGMNAGLLHAWSRTCALDVDDYAGAAEWLRGVGVNLDALFLDERAVMVKSPKPNHGKLLYRLPDDVDPLRTFTIEDERGGTLLELRCASANELSMQDVVAGVYPDDGVPELRGEYELRGDPAAMPTLPGEVLALWRKHLANGRPVAAAATGASVWVPDSTIVDLRSALCAIRADDRGTWVAIAHALHELGDRGRAPWLEWSQTSEKYDPVDAARVWDSIRAVNHTGYAAVFARAQALGWVNPRKSVATEHAVDTTTWDEPIDVFAKFAAPPLTPDDVPGVIADFADAQARAAGFDPTATIVAGVAGMAGALHDGIRLRLPGASSWFESARLWVAIIGGPASGKTPSIKAMIDPLRSAHRELVQAWARTQAGKKPEERDPKPALYTSDATVEALSEILRDNPRGIIFLSDEFESWLASHDAYRNGKGSRDRGEWLRLYDGGPHQVDRITRGAFFVTNWGASILTATTPAALTNLARHLPNDGLLQRFLLFSVRPMRDREAMMHATIDGAQRAFDLRMREVLSYTPDNGGGVVRMSAGAREVFELEEQKLRELTTAAESCGDSFASHVGKQTAMLARLTLTFHAAGRAGHPAAAEIDAGSAMLAVRFMRKAFRHSYAIYGGTLSSNGALEVAREIASAILAKSMTSFNRRELSRAGRAGRGDNEKVLDALRHLAHLGWIALAAGCRDERAHGVRWSVNPRVHQVFGDAAKRIRQQRTLIRERLTGINNEPGDE